MRRKNRHGVTEDQVFIPIKDPFLPIREVIQTEETWPLGSIFFSHNGKTALDSSGVVLEADSESPARDFPLPDSLKQSVTFPKLQPCFLLV
jgi:hypothetical protein